MAKRAYKEDAFQECVILKVNQRSAEDERYKYIYHVPNGGARDATVGATLKRMGVRRGVPDLQWDIARHGYHGLRIELKCAPHKTTDEQDEWLQNLANEGFCCYVVHDDVAEVMRILEWYLNGEGDDQP